MAETPPAIPDAALEKLITEVCGALDYRGSAVTVCDSPDCSAIQCRLHRAVRALLDERDSLRARLEALHRVEQLAEVWTDAEFWNAQGNMLDSMDCGKDLQAAVAGSASEQEGR